LFDWRDRLLEAGKVALNVRMSPDQDERVHQLERVVGRLTVEKDIFKKPNKSNTR